MATEQVATAPVPNPAVAEAVREAPLRFPLQPLTSSEIRAASHLVRSLYLDGAVLYFKQVSLNEPPKAQLAPYLDALAAGQSPAPLGRVARVTYYIENTDKFFEALVDLARGAVQTNYRLGPNIHGSGDGEEIIKIENVVLQDSAVKAEIAKLKLPEGSVVVCDPWIYGADGVDDDRRMYQCFMYMRGPESASLLDSNHYALPLPISPVVDTERYTVCRIDIMPTGVDASIKPLSQHRVAAANEYLPEKQELRRDLKPLHVVQPEGASFSVDASLESSRTVSWQKWKMFLSFNAREGMVLHDVRYDGRPLFHRVALSDMSIPYADPRRPFHKKQAFDLGDAGAGGMANNLRLGCDCLGSIHYMSATLADPYGEPMAMPNVVCMHEQDNGIGWKHTNYRTGHAAVVRNRELVLQSIITVSNYEYVLAFIFNQAAEMHYEVRATGILSTQPVDEGVRVPWGTVVHPGVLATHHQHIFSLRLDPMIDGHANRLKFSEALPMPRSADLNPHGVGYYVQDTLVEQSCGLDLDIARNRTFTIQNAAVTNPVNGLPVGYKIAVPDFQKILADRDSYHFRRAEFADHNVYVTAHRDGEFYAAGPYTNQSRGGTGVRSYADRRDPVADTDLVLWLQFGMNHVPRIEDFPVMPAEHMRLALKPVNFFTRNPALDVPPSEQAFNRSTELAERHRQPAAEAKEVQQGSKL